MNQQFLFPYESMRQEQNKLIRDVDFALRNRQHLIAHAPTGLGKTISTLGPALKIAEELNLKVFFVTPRHTQHKIAIETARTIKEKFGNNFPIADFIGKKWMCAQEGVTALTSGQFAEFCKKKTEERTCNYYTNTKSKDGKITIPAQALVSDLIPGMYNNEQICHIGKEKEFCPYEINSYIAQKARLVIGDYYHMLHPEIRKRFLKRCNVEIENCIVIIDEAHNVASRTRDLLSVMLSNFVVNAAKREAENCDEEVQKIVNYFSSMMTNLERHVGSSEGEEQKISKNFVVDLIRKEFDYNHVIATLRFASDNIKEEKKQSFLGLIADFLDKWQGENYGYVRLAKKEGKRFSIQYRCLDPSLVTADLISESYATIAMSGTLAPLEMYKQTLGFPENTISKSYENPFENKNRLNMIIPQTSTKYAQRGEEMYKKMAAILGDVVNRVPGNSALFFPSYYLRDKIGFYLNNVCKKSTFSEDPKMTKLEREEFLNNFKSYKDTGAVLLGAVAGSFGEGIDLPGDLLKCVVIVGIPLGKPDIETQELIGYYDAKFKQGWNYGYILPAMSKVLQGAGRCIRSETDRGVIIFLDERFTWKNYYSAFPKDWDIKITGLYNDRIDEFFNLKQQVELQQ
jgi:DNA excision repair protein ERCC-2